MPKFVPDDVVDEFLDLVCSGMPFDAACGAVGVSTASGGRWWRAYDVVGTRIRIGKGGGLAGSAPSREPGTVGPDESSTRHGHPGSGSEGRRRQLSSEDRAVIAAMVRAGRRPAQIAAEIGRCRSVISREIQRNTSPDGRYRGPVAHRAAHERRRRPKAFKLHENTAMCRRIESWMDDGWSPGLIAATLAKDAVERCRRVHGVSCGLGRGCGCRVERVSHETIYQALYVQTRGRLRADLHQKLMLKRRARKPRTGRTDARGVRYSEAFTIADRPAEVADRAVPGHWEGDLILGTGNRSAIGTLVERATRFTILLHLPGRHDADSVATAMIQEMGHLPEHLRRSITWDRGSELADYARIQLELQAPVFFCDPHSPWQRGTNENTNRLLRFWFEKGTDLSTHTAEDLRVVADKLNKRPRPTLDLQTPAQRLAQMLAAPAGPTVASTD